MSSPAHSEAMDDAEHDSAAGEDEIQEAPEKRKTKKKASRLKKRYADSSASESGDGGEEEEEEADGDEEDDDEMKDFFQDKESEGSASDGSDSSSDAAQESLDEEDMELIAENLGQRSAAGGRLRRAHSSDSEASGEGAPRSLFHADDDHVQETGEEGQEWIEGDVSAADRVYGTSAGLSSEGLAIVESIFGDVNTVFKILGHRALTGADQVEEDERPSEEEGHGKAEGSEMWMRIAGDPEELANEFMLEADQQIRQEDQPERLRQRFEGRPTSVPAANLVREADWICRRLRLEMPALFDEPAVRALYQKSFGDSDPDHSCFFPRDKSIDEDVREKISQLLHFLLNDRIEVPVIAAHKGHLLMPPLTEEALWRVYDLDAEYFRLSESFKHLKMQADHLSGRPREEAMAMLKEGFDTEETTEDIRAFISYNLNLGACDGGAVPEEPSAGRKKRRAPAALDSVLIAHRHQLHTAWQPHLLAPEQFEANMQSCFSAVMRNAPCQQPYLPPDGPPLPGRSLQAVKEWCEASCCGPFSTGSKVYEVLLKYEASRLGHRPAVRQLLRTFYRDHCRVTFTTNSKGEQKVDPAADDWTALRVFRKPIAPLLDQVLEATDEQVEFLLHPEADLPDGNVKREHYSMGEPSAYENACLSVLNGRETRRHRELFHQMLRFEEKGLGHITIHPVASSDAVPWRSPMADLAEFKERLQGQVPQEIRDREAEAFAVSDKEDEDLIESLLHALVTLYAVPGNGWGDLQIGILRRLLERELFPLFRKEARQLLTRSSQSHVTKEAARQFSWRLNMQPYSHPSNRPFYELDSDSDDQEEDSDSDIDEDDESEDAESHPVPKVAACIVEEAKSPAGKHAGFRLHVVLVDRTGNMQHHRKFEMLFHLRRLRRMQDESVEVRRELARAEKEEADLTAFVRHYSTHPDVVLVAPTDMMRSLEIFEFFINLRDTLKKKHQFEVLLASMEVPRLMVSCDSLFKEERLRGLSNEAILGIAMAQNLQDPLSAALSLWSENPRQDALLEMRLHPQQSCVPPERLAEALEKECIRATCAAGVDINMMRLAAFRSAPLKFVPGLGPRKAAHLYGKLLHQPILLRKQLLDEATDEEHTEDSLAVLGEQVYYNAAPFLRIPLNQDGEEDRTGASLLDCTRIHPIESLPIAQKMCKDAHDMDVSNPVMETLKNPETLDELDLEAYAHILAERGSRRMLPYLQFVKQEILAPYADPRCPFAPIAASRATAALLGEAESDLRAGAEIMIRVQHRSDNTMTAVFPPSNIRVSIIDTASLVQELEALYYEQIARQNNKRGVPPRSSRLQDLIPDGSLLSARIVQVQHVSMELWRDEKRWMARPPVISVALSTEKVRLLLEDHCVRRHVLTEREMSPMWEHDLNVNAGRVAATFTLTQANAGSARPRMVRHPNFRPYPPQKALEHLRSSSIAAGQCIICPVEQHQDRLCLLLKVSSDPFVYKSLPILEDEETNGSKLTVGNQTFNSLEQLVDVYVNSVASNMDCFVRHQHFCKNMDAETAQNALVQQQRDIVASSGPKRIVWGMVLDKEFPPNAGKIRTVLIAVVAPSQRMGNTHSAEPIVFKDSLYITDQGFHLWWRSEGSLDKLLDWWKREGFTNRREHLKKHQEAQRRRYVNQQPPPDDWRHSQQYVPQRSSYAHHPPRRRW